MTVASSAPPDPSALYAVAVCPRCGGDHPHAQCPQVRAVEYDGEGRLRRVEYFEGTGARPLAQRVTSTGAGWKFEPPWPVGADVRDISIQWGYCADWPRTVGDEEEE